MPKMLNISKKIFAKESGMPLRLLALFMIAVILAGFAGCSKPPEEESSSEESVSEDESPAEYPLTVAGTVIQSRPTRVISLAPGITEKLYELGLEEYLTGVSDYCDYPPQVAELDKCGTAQLPNLKEIQRLKPHVIIAQTQMSDDDLIALQQMDIDIVIIPPADSIESYKDSYVSLERLLEGEFTGGAAGRKFAQNLQDRLDYLADYLKPYADEVGAKKVLYLRLLDFNVATGDTLESKLLENIGLVNIAYDQTGWVYPEDLAKGDGRALFESIDIIYMDEKFVTIKMLEQSAFYKGLQATLKDRFLYIDSLLFERQSLRMLSVLDDMASYAYPDATPPVPFADNSADDEDDEEEIQTDEDEDDGE